MEGEYSCKVSEEVDKISDMEEAHQTIVMVKEHECGLHFSTNEVNKFTYIKCFYWINWDSDFEILLNLGISYQR